MIIFIVLLLFIGSPKATRILLLGEKAEKQLVALFEEAQSSTFKVSTIYIDHDQEDEAEQNSTFCSHLNNAGSFAAIADMTWGGWDAAKLIASETGIPYIRIEVDTLRFWIE